MSAVSNVLVIGAGPAGTAAGILLAQAGVSVDIIDIKPDAGALGSGITLQGNALRVLRQLGVWESVSEHGYAFTTLGLRAPDENGSLIVEMPDARTGGPDLPATLGMERPELARILLDRAAAVGAKLHFGTTVTQLEQDATGVDVTLLDGTRHRYDLVIGADGIRSATRTALGIPQSIRATGMGIWRVYVTRPESVTRTDLYYGGRCYIAGYCPTGENSVYAYLVEDAQDRNTLSPDEALEVVRDLAAGYHGPWDDIRERLTDPGSINYTKFETHLLEAPWNRGRVVLIGDAAHACPPTLAQGAAQALEDAAVLTELLIDRDELSDEMWTTFTDRRIRRAKPVVDGSLQIGQWLLDHEQGDVAGLMHTISELLSDPA